MWRPCLTTVLFVAVVSDSAVACIERVIVRPTGTITSDDSVSLEIRIGTPTSSAHLGQPTEVVVLGYGILVDLYADGGLLDSPDSMVETVELGTLNPGTYQYEVEQHLTEYCKASTITGSFCVEDATCNHHSCRCPVFYPKYTIIDLGTLGGVSSIGLGINDLGHVVGSADTSEGVRHAFVWDAGVMTDLGALPRTNPRSEAWDINNVGQVAGTSYFAAAGARAVMWDNGKIIDLGTLGGNSWGHGINEAGQVVGSSDVSGFEKHAFLWEDAIMTDLGTLGGTHSIAWDINNVGQVTGESFTDGSPGGGFLWQDHVMKNLGTLGGGGSEAFGLNDFAQVVGWSARQDGSNSAFLWHEGEMLDLGALAGFDTSSWAQAINNAGQVIGYGGFGKSGGAFLYDPKEGFAFLQDMIPVDSGWSEFDVRDINDKGQIVGTGTFVGLGGGRHAFLMTPAPQIPTVSTWGMIVMTLSVVAAGIVVIVHATRRGCQRDPSIRAG